MGLAIDVGHLASFRGSDPEAAQWVAGDLLKVNEVLAELNLPTHREPTELPAFNSRAPIESFPYSYLHYLRRLYARMVNDSTWTPVPVAEGEDPARDPAVEEQTFMLNSHLLCHSDCEGYYFPIELEELVFDEEAPAGQNGRIRGGTLGSSISLRIELIGIAPSLGINLDGEGNLSDEEVARIESRIGNQDPWETELIVWIALFEACRLSLELSSAIVFC